MQEMILNTRKKKKFKKPRGPIRPGLKRFLFILLVFSAMIAFGHLYRFSKNHGKSAETEFPSGIEVEEFEKYMKKKKNISSDIKGMSQYDKYKMGLNYKDGSDSDHDGLSDKDEIEVYKTDPLKASTAGDLYTDGYKVKHNLPLFSVCEYKKKIKFFGNKCREVKLEADEPSDLNAVVEDYTTRYSLEYYGIKKIYKGFWLYNYSGKVKLNLSSVLKKNNVDYDDITVWVVKGAFLVSGLSEMEKCSYTASDNLTVLDYDFQKNEEYFIYVTEKKKLSIGTSLISNTETSGIGFMYGFPMVQQLFAVGMHINYSEMDTEKESKKVAKHTVACCNKNFNSGIKTSDKSKVKGKSYNFIRMKEKIISLLLPWFEYDPKAGPSIFNYFFSYMSYSDSGYDIGMSPAASGEKENSYSGEDNLEGFNPYIDELPFPNFSSEYGTGGNCVGIAHLTSYLYNRKEFHSKGRYKCKVNGKERVVKWNIKRDDENKTLLDVGLCDYKGKSFVDRHSGDGTDYLVKNLSKGEKQFKKMIGCYLQKGNRKFNLDDYTNVNGEHDDWSMIEKMKNYLDSGKIVDVYMRMKAGYGHAVNVYGYQFVSKNEMAFYVYDSNLPQDKRDGFKLNFEVCALQVKKIKDESGKEKFEYLYYPLKGEENITYMASSNQGLMAENAIVILDEKWNVLK